MRGWAGGLILGMLFGWTIQTLGQGGLGQAAELKRVRLVEIPMEALQGGVMSVPPTYGHLVDVAISSEVHHLYFQDPQGTVRMVRVGPQGAVTKARRQVPLLLDDVYVIKRHEPESGEEDQG